ncbi:MAG: glycosyltransferase [Lachnospiraceae bacterium]|nr:glycosyltransferase [Lachnospiraceae bacterium]
MKNVSFSVLMSIYYKENPSWFRDALESVFSQSIMPNEFVLVKDGPLTPDLNSVIEEFKLKYSSFKTIENETNLGLGLSLRKGVLSCSNDIIARMDSDDLIPKDRFEKQLKVIEEGYDVVSCWSSLFIGSANNIIAIKKRPENNIDIEKLAKRRSPVCHAACMMRKSSILAAGNYIHCLYYEDYHLWVRMLMQDFKFYNIQEVLYWVRTTDDQLQRRSGFKYLKNELKVFREFYKIGFYSLKDLVVNSIIRVFVRLLPHSLRSFVFKLIWNFKN